MEAELALVTVSEVSGIKVAAIHGRFDITTAKEIGPALRQASQDQYAFVVSLEQCSYIDLDGVATLVAFHRRLDGRFVIVGECEYSRSLQTTGLSRVMRFASSVDDALSILSAVR